MAHAFERGVFSGRKPAWHGLGIVAEEDFLTIDELDAYDPTILSPIVARKIRATGVAPITDWRANVRTIDGKCVGIGGKDYTIVQPREMFEFGADIIDSADGGGIVAATTLYDGKRVTATLQLPGEITIAGDAGERHLPFLNLANSYDGSMALTACVSWVRVVCANTLQLALATAPRRFSLRHTSGVAGRVIDARKALGITYKAGERWEIIGNELVQTSYTSSEFEELVTKILMPATGYHKKSDRRLSNLQERQDDLLSHYAQTPTIERIRETKWGALNAVSEWEQHYAYADRTPDRQVTALFDDGVAFAKTFKALVPAELVSA